MSRVAICLYAGAGGLATGLERAGFSVGAAIETDRDAARSFQRNVRSFRGDVVALPVEECSGRHLLATAGLGAGQPELLAAGLPGEASKAAYWRNGAHGRIPQAVHQVLRLTNECRPRLLLIDAVPALRYKPQTGPRPIDELVRDLHKLGYSSRWAVMDPASFGVPQTRERVVLIAAADGVNLPVLPSATHVSPSAEALPGLGLLPWRTAADALAGLPDIPEDTDEVAGRWGHLLPQVPQGGNYQDLSAPNGIGRRFPWRSRYWTFLLKLSPDAPAPTIAGRPGPYVGPFHWDNRRLRVPEMQRLLSLPDDFYLAGQRTSIQQQLGNATPPQFAHRIATELAVALEPASATPLAAA